MLPPCRASRSGTETWASSSADLTGWSWLATDSAASEALDRLLCWLSHGMPMSQHSNFFSQTSLDITHIHGHVTLP